MENIYAGLGHITVNTASMAESIAFYEKIGGRLLAEDKIEKPEGTLLLSLVDIGGVTIELLQHPDDRPLISGSIPHFALLVHDVDKAAAAIKAAGVDSFKTPEKSVCPNTFGGLDNWFFIGPSGEEIELLKMY